MRILLPEGKAYKLNPLYAMGLAALGRTPLVTGVDDPQADPLAYDALLLCGGVDIDPARFGEPLLEGAPVEIDHARDDLELSLLAAFIGAGKPVLGICRGLQVINVGLGGTLWQDLPSQCGLVHSAPKGEEAMTHEVYMDSGVLLVNSFHHQAVKELGYGLRCLGRAEDGVVEAIRHETLPIAAVQWHPERMEDGLSLLFTLLN